MTSFVTMIPSPAFGKKEASSESSSRKITLKLLIDKTNEKVVFAEAGKDFIDFLFHLMLLPVGMVISLLKEKGMAGSLEMLHNSIENFNDAYTQPGFNKDLLLKPRAPSFNPDSSLLLLNDTIGSSANMNNHSLGYQGPIWSGPTHPAVKNPTSREGDYVKELATYMVRDDLEVKPMSTVSCIALLSAFNVKDVGALEEKVVEFGMDEGIKFLQTSLQSKTVLTDVFLSNR